MRLFINSNQRIVNSPLRRGSSENTRYHIHSILRTHASLRESYTRKYFQNARNISISQNTTHNVLQKSNKKHRATGSSGMKNRDNEKKESLPATKVLRSCLRCAQHKYGCANVWPAARRGNARAREKLRARVCVCVQRVFTNAGPSPGPLPFPAN